jgi:hypothetical protein
LKRAIAISSVFFLEGPPAPQAVWDKLYGEKFENGYRVMNGRKPAKTVVQARRQIAGGMMSEKCAC